jgi:hypothetical protein
MTSIENPIVIESQESQESQASLTAAMGGIAIELCGAMPKPNRIHTTVIILESNDGDRFVPQNASFTFNPDDDDQVADTKKKVEKLKKLAVKKKVNFFVKTHENNDAGILITQVGGASNGFCSKKFEASASWIIPRDPDESEQPRRRRRRAAA